MAEDIKTVSGGLVYCIERYINWEPCDKEVQLDGDFTAAELREIADHMEKYTPPAAMVPKS
jgi:hypothetical protein